MHFKWFLAFTMTTGINEDELVVPTQLINLAIEPPTFSDTKKTVLEHQWRALAFHLVVDPYAFIDY